MNIKTIFSYGNKQDSYGGLITFNKDIQSNNTVYSDRLYQWDSNRHDILCQRVFGNKRQDWDYRTPESIERFLQKYFKKTNLSLVKITKYINQSNGYPVWRFDYNL